MNTVPFKLAPFKLERYFAKYEFSSKYLLSSSDCDGLLQRDLLRYADEETLSLWENLQLGYTESLGSPLLREEVSKLYRSIRKEEVLILTPEEGIFIALNCLLNPGDHLICTFPGYQSLYSIAESLGCEVTKWRPVEEKGWAFDLADLEKAIRPNTKLIVVNFPHNPTGYLPSSAEYERIIDLARERNITLFSDEMYRFLEYDAQDRLDSAVDLYDNAISLFGMSKTFGLAGARIGWLATRNKEFYERCATYKDFTTICSSAPSEILSLIALRAREKIISDNLTKLKLNLAILEEFMNRNRELFSWVKPKAGTICFPRINLPISIDEFCEKLVNETGIMLLPSTVYDYDDRHFRIGFGRESLSQVLEVFEDYLHKE